jgi:hypothetical protein
VVTGEGAPGSSLEEICERVEYDMDTEDERFIEDLSKKQSIDISEDLLEIIIDHLEKDTARKVEFKNSFLTF